MLFEGVTETGALFGGKRSYLPTEIHWGYVFAEITHQSKGTSTRHAVDLSRSARVPSSVPWPMRLHRPCKERMLWKDLTAACSDFEIRRWQGPPAGLVLWHGPLSMSSMFMYSGKRNISPIMGPGHPVAVTCPARES